MDECSLNTHNCDSRSDRRICTNTAGSFTCGCRSGYQIAADGRTCNGKSLNMPTILERKRERESEMVSLKIYSTLKRHITNYLSQAPFDGECKDIKDVKPNQTDNAPRSNINSFMQQDATLRICKACCVQLKLSLLSRCGRVCR